MKIDITLKITPKMVTDAQGNEKKAFVGHLGYGTQRYFKEHPQLSNELCRNDRASMQSCGRCVVESWHIC